VVDARVSGHAAAAAMPDLATLGRLGASLPDDLLFAALPPAFALIMTALHPDDGRFRCSGRRRSPTLSTLCGAANFFAISRYDDACAQRIYPKGTPIFGMASRLSRP
jgi:hypothetical protein